MNIYVDASFLVSTYSVDANTGTATRMLSVLREALLITTFGELEFVNALNLRVFRNEISALEAESSKRVFDNDLHSGLFQLKSLPEHVFLRARQVSEQTAARVGTRTSDLLHIAAALELGVDAFYTFDRKQAKLAQMLKLKTNLFA